MLIDRWGRQITYLRVSVTDRCNMRCVYCMPPEGIQRRSHDEIMRYEEIVAVARVAAKNGVRRVRLTGGEPLIRSGLPELVRSLAAIPGIEDISLTTNGILLEKMAGDLKSAGLTRINLSLDTLQVEKFARITRGGSLAQVLRGLAAAEQCGLRPIKINVVAINGVNQDELQDLARLTLAHDWHVRFIELMPVNNQQSWGEGFPAPVNAYLSIQAIKKALEPLGLAPVDQSYDGPAKEFVLTGGAGRIGFISPLSEHFCSLCNRLRVTADGSFRSCLLQDIEVPFLAALRAGEPVLPLMLQAIELKPSGHGLRENQLPSARCMVQIGG